MPDQLDRPLSFSRSLAIAGLSLGFAMAGFFDGILLHQILQWHSLFSSLDGQIYQDLRFRMLTDGLFHAAMYVVGLVGLWLLWRARAEFSSAASGRRFASSLLLGFGAWHRVDAVLNHWLLGLHHIKEGDPNWLMWDLAFFALGALSITIALVLRRRGGHSGGGPSTGIAVSTVALLVLLAGAVAAVPRPGTQSVTVVFERGVRPAAVLAAVEKAGGQILWSNPHGDVWAVAVENSWDGWSFYASGALYVSGSFFGSGCFSSTPAPTA